MMPGVKVADIARKHGTTRWQISADAPLAVPGSDLEIVVGDVVIRAGAGVDEVQRTRAIRAARAAAS